MEEDAVCYILEQGQLTLRFRKEPMGVALDCQLHQLEAVHDVSPLFGAKPTGCTQAFRQGWGTGGASGFVTLGQDAKADSDGVFALDGGDGCFTLHASDHTRYRNRYGLRDGRVFAAFDAEGTSIAELPSLHIWEGTAFSDALRACALDIAQAMNACGQNGNAFHWCSWYYLYHNLDMDILEAYLAGFQQHRDAFPFSHIQIDAGYFLSAGD